MTLIPDLFESIVANNLRHSAFIETARGELSPEEEAELEQYLNFLICQGHDLDFVALSYNTLTFDTLREQIYFHKHKRYRYSRFDQVAPNVYFNEAYMEKYMIGVAIAAFLWPQLVGVRRHFAQTLPIGRTGTYLEIGPGHGRYLLTAIETTSFDRFVGVDISPTSCELTSAVIEHHLGALPGNVEIKLQDFLDEDGFAGPYAAVVMGEVLEHVEQPEAFLLRIASISDADTHIHITTCINSPAVDHIYLYATVDQLEQQFADCGLAVRDRLLVPHLGKTLDECEIELLPINVTYTLEKVM